MAKSLSFESDARQAIRMVVDRYTFPSSSQNNYFPASACSLVKFSMKESTHVLVEPRVVKIDRVGPGGLIQDVVCPNVKTPRKYAFLFDTRSAQKQRPIRAGQLTSTVGR